MSLLKKIFGVGKASSQSTDTGEQAALVESLLDQMKGSGVGEFLTLAKRHGFRRETDEIGVEDGNNIRVRKLVLQSSNGSILALGAPARNLTDIEASRLADLEPYRLDTVVSSQKKPFQIIQLMDSGKRTHKMLKGPPEDSLVIRTATITGYFCAVPPRALEKYRTTQRGVVEVMENPATGGKIWRESMGIVPGSGQVHIVSLINDTSLAFGDALKPFGAELDGDGVPTRSIFLRPVRIHDAPDSETVLLGIIFRKDAGDQSVIEGSRPARFA
ncbi:MAG: hypothetical protein ACLQHT_09010 [Terracidiphilus sp.]